MDLIITIDTEGDNQWERPARVTTENLAYVPRFQELCDRYGFKPTYLCTHEVVVAADFDRTLRVLQEDGRAEIGAHLHPWTNPPFRGESGPGLDLSDYPAYPSELPIERFHDKLDSLTKLIRRRTGAPATSYRAGRWGFSAAHIPVLLELGYVVDCSVTPCVSWRHIRGIQGDGPDFTRAPVHPYFLDADDVCRPGSSKLLEVPATIMFSNRALRKSPSARRVVRALRKTLPVRLLNRLVHLDPEWFRPYPGRRAQEMIVAGTLALKSNLQCAEMMFHSSELMPGCSPYNPTRESVEDLFVRFEAVFEMLATAGCKGETLSGFAAKFRQLE